MILKKAKSGTKVYLVPGNHDEFFRQFEGLSFDDVVICNKIFYETKDGRKFIIIHGDEYMTPVLNIIGLFFCLARLVMRF